MDKYLWIGAVGDKDYLKQLVELGCRQSTAYNVQNKIIQGIEYNKINVDTISGHVVPPFPKYKKSYIKKRKWFRTDDTLNVDVAFLNIPFLNLYFKCQSLKKEVNNWAKKNENNSKILMVYSLHSPFLIAACAIKKNYKNTKLIAFVPDLPEYMNDNQSAFRKFLKKIDRKLIDKCIKKIDGFILFAEGMRERLPIEKKPYIVMEGILSIDYEKYLNKIYVKKYHLTKKIIMISGNLNKDSGVYLLLDAFSEIDDDNYELWITGTLEDNISLDKYYEKDSRIKYFGYIESYDTFLELQSKADVFVAMVPPSNPKSKYFFPSKIMEYLITGAPVIAFKLECIPKEYYNHIFFFDNENIESIVYKIKYVCNLSAELKSKMAIDRYDLIKLKTKEAQGARVIQLIYDIKA
jgi:glycosyltransferase involved in cell wall biosynthesis